jgi:hypothetical protein
MIYHPVLDLSERYLLAGDLLVSMQDIFVTFAS